MLSNGREKAHACESVTAGVGLKFISQYDTDLLRRIVFAPMTPEEEKKIRVLCFLRLWEEFFSQ